MNIITIKENEVLSMYGNVKLIGPLDEIKFILDLIMKAQMSQIRKSAK